MVRDEINNLKTTKEVHYKKDLGVIFETNL